MTSLIIFFDNMLLIKLDNSGYAWIIRKIWYGVKKLFLWSWLIKLFNSTLDNAVNKNNNSGIIHCGFLKKLSTWLSINSDEEDEFIFFENDLKKSIGIKSSRYCSRSSLMMEMTIFL